MELSNTSGATLTIAVWNEARGELTVAHAGDSSAILVEPAGVQVLTEEHRLSDSAEERARVQGLGLKLGRAVAATGQAGGPLRAWPGGLAVCRTIGDADCPAASPVPAVRPYTLRSIWPPCPQPPAMPPHPWPQPCPLPPHP